MWGVIHTAQGVLGGFQRQGGNKTSMSASSGILLAWTGGFGKEPHWGCRDETRDGSSETLKATRPHLR